MSKKRTYERPVSKMFQINAGCSLMAASGGKYLTVDGTGVGSAPEGVTPGEIDAKDNNNVWGENIWEE
mgnify:FL=1